MRRPIGKDSFGDGGIGVLEVQTEKRKECRLMVRTWLYLEKIDRIQIAVEVERRRFVINESDATRHAGGEIYACRSKDDDRPAGHVFAGVVSDALDHENSPGIAHGEAFAGRPGDENFT